MFCQLRDTVNAKKSRVKPYICVSFSDSKYVPTNNKKHFRRQNSLNKLLNSNH